MVLLHQQAEIVVLAFQLGVLVGKQFFFQESINFFGNEHGGGAIQVPNLAFVGPDDKVVHGARCLGDSEQFPLQFGLADADQWMSRIEQAIHLGRSQSQCSQTLDIHFRAIFLLELVYKRRLRDFSPAVAADFLRQFPAALLQGGQSLLFYKFDQVEAVVCTDWSGQISWFRQFKCRIFKLFHHLARAKPGEKTSLVRRGGVFAVLHGQRFKRLSAEQQALNFLDSPFCIGDLVLGGVGRHANHDVGDLHFTSCLSFPSDFENVVPKPSPNHVAHLTFGRVECGTFEGIDHLKCGEPAQIASVGSHGGVL